jgi:signal transduction histidine kinase
MVEGEPRPLPPGLETSAYRIVQEALANARKHAGDGARVAVTVRYRESALDLEIRDDGRGAASTTETPGHGLIAMRERVAFFGGVFVAESLGAAGFLVRASLPLPATRA